MPRVKCSVEECENVSYDIKKQLKSVTTEIKKTSFHVFPKVFETRQNWILFCTKETWNPSKYSKICGEHFKPLDFVEDDDRYPNRKVLKNNGKQN
jgi:hypothetical protein